MLPKNLKKYYLVHTVLIQAHYRCVRKTLENRFDCFLRAHILRSKNFVEKSLTKHVHNYVFENLRENFRFNNQFNDKTEFKSRFLTYFFCPSQREFFERKDADPVRKASLRPNLRKVLAMLFPTFFLHTLFKLFFS